MKDGIPETLRDWLEIAEKCFGVQSKAAQWVRGEILKKSAERITDFSINGYRMIFNDMIITNLFYQHPLISDLLYKKDINPDCFKECFRNVVDDLSGQQELSKLINDVQKGESNE